MRCGEAMIARLPRSTTNNYPSVRCVAHRPLHCLHSPRVWVAGAAYLTSPPAGHAVSVAPSQRVTRVRFNQQGLSLAACDDSGGLWVWQVLRPDVVSHSLRVKACLGHVALWPSLITGLHAVPRETSLRHRVPQLSLPRCHGWRGCLCTVRCSRCRAMVAALTCLPTRRAVRQAHFVGPV